jgi:transcriptional regulator with XRE-family HTH domain
MVNIGKRLRKIRVAKGVTQGDIYKATGQLRCYVSRLENGHTMPSLETLEKIARAFHMPFHDFLYELTYNPREAKTAEGSEPRGDGTEERVEQIEATEPGKPDTETPLHSPEQTPKMLDCGQQ